MYRNLESVTLSFFHWYDFLGFLQWDRVLLDQVEHWQSYLALVNMILSCTGIPGHYPVNETTSSLTLTFWYTLQVENASLKQCLVVMTFFYLILPELQLFT